MREFWDELCNRLKEKGYTIISSPTDKNISDTAHYLDYKKGFRNNNDYGVDFQPISGLRLYVWNEYGYYLYWGCRKDNKTTAENTKKIKQFCDGRDGYETATGGHLFWKIFEIDEEEKIYLPDFSYPGTFNLIQPEYRNRIITQMVKEIKKFVNTIEKTNITDK